MSRFIAGAILGLVLGVAATAGAESLMSQGYLHGWSVIGPRGAVCDAPFIWPATREIDCS